MSLAQGLQKEAAEEAAEDAHREEEARPATHPLAVRGTPASGHNAVQVGMEMKILSPGMQDGEEAGLRAQMFGVTGNGVAEQGLGDTGICAAFEQVGGEAVAERLLVLL